MTSDSDKSERGIDEIKNHFSDIESIYKDYMEDVFEINNKIQNTRDEVSYLVSEVCNLIREIITKIVSKNRICIKKELTIRDGNIYRYSSSKKADNKKVLNNQNLKEYIINNLENKNYKEKFEKSFDLAKLVFNSKSRCNFFSVVECSYEDVSNTYFSRKSEEEPKIYYIIYRPTSSAKDKIKISYQQSKSKIEALRQHTNNTSKYNFNKATVSKKREKRERGYIKQLRHSNSLEKAVKSSYKKVRGFRKVVKQVLEDIKEMFSLILVSHSI